MERRNVRARHQRGQSIVEYLLIIGAIILALVAIKSTVETRMTSLRDEAMGKVDTAKSTVETKVDAKKH